MALFAAARNIAQASDEKWFRENCDCVPDADLSSAIALAIEDGLIAVAHMTN